MLINTKVRLGWEHDDGALKKTKKVILHVCLSTEGFQSYLVGASTVRQKYIYFDYFLNQNMAPSTKT